MTRDTAFRFVFWLSVAIFLSFLAGGLIHRFALSGSVAFIGLDHLSEADASRERGDYVRALEQYTRAVEVAPGDYQAWLRLGVTAQSLGNEDIAVNAFRSVIKINRQHAGAHYLLGLHYLQHNDLDRAFKHNQLAIRANPRFSEAYNNLATALLRMGDKSAAISYYRKALALNPDLAAARGSLESLGEVADSKQSQNP